MGLLAVDAIGSLPTVIGLDGKTVLPLALTVQRFLGANQTLTSGAVQHHCLKLDRART